MGNLKNPFICFKDPSSKQAHSPYSFNPFTVIGVSKEAIDMEEISDKIEEIRFDLDPERIGDLNPEDYFFLTNIVNAQKYLENPVQRLAFELLIVSDDNTKL